MNHERIDKSGPSAKRRKPSDENVEIPPDIFRLTVDCSEELFDYLPLKDLINVGQTCQRMQRIAGHCFLQNYGAVQGDFYENHLYISDLKLDYFINYIQNVSIDDDFSDDEDEFADDNVSEVVKYRELYDFVTPLKHAQSLKRIELGHLELTTARIEEMKKILSKAEHLAIDDCEYDEHLLDSLLAACSNMKHLIIDGSALHKTEHKWLQRCYPMLEDIELLPAVMHEVPALKTFTELNTNIKRFSVNMQTLWSNRELFKNINLKLDVLAIDYNKNGIDLNTFFRLLNDFHEHGFYKKLHFYYGYSRFQQEIIDELVSVKGLVKLRAKMDTQHVTVSNLRNLEELCINESCFITDLKSLPNILTKLKRIQFGKASSDDILPFISQATDLEKIKVSSLLSGSHFDEHDKILHLSGLNKKREQLIGARKIIIYVREDVYLATKWSMKQNDFKLIEMKRLHSYDFNHEFDLHHYRYE